MWSVGRSTGNKFNLGHLVRAICCRVPDSINKDLPSGFKLRHPYVGRVSVYVPSGLGGKTSGDGKNVSVNWLDDGVDIEILDSRAGVTEAR